ncbi:MAG: hypothetical protein ABSC55_15515 [Syntrophorhabdales bacterium]
MTAHDGFALIAVFLRQIGFAQMIEKAFPVTESSPNGMGIYGKIVGYASMVYAGAARYTKWLSIINYPSSRTTS